MAYSDFANEMLKSKGIITGCANYYIFSTSDLADLNIGEMAIPPLNAVMACYYYPYLPNDYSVYTEEFIEVEPEITANEDGVQFEFSITPPFGPDLPIVSDEKIKIYFKNPLKVTSAFDETIGNRLLFQFDAYHKLDSVKTIIQAEGKNLTAFDWRYEGKLYQYPYRYFEFNDGLMSPMYIEPQHLASNTGNEFRVRQYLNPHGSYECYIKGYKGDTNGLVFPNEIPGLEVPVANDQYLNYLNENKNQRRVAYFNQAINLAVGAANFAANPAVGILGIANSVTGLMSQVAYEQDLKRLPNSLSLGGMYQFGLQKQNQLYMTTHRINDQDMERIALHFHMYGYQQNKLMIPNIKNRKYWNYIKCTQCNLKGNGIPKDQLVKLKQIFQAGTTIWHIDNNATVGDYSKDNPEVY